MPIAVKNLAQGQLGVTKAAIYTCPFDTSAIVRNIVIGNSAAHSNTVTLYFKSAAGTSRLLSSLSYSVEPGSIYLPLEGGLVTLGDGDSIEGIAETAAEVDYFISGVEVLS